MLMKAPAPARSVLMVSYAFPPEAYVGGRRTLKYCKYLGQFGWRPIVLTIRPRSDAFQDDRLTEQLPEDVRVLRTRDWDAATIVDTVSRWLKPLKRSSADPEPGARRPETAARSAEPGARSPEPGARSPESGARSPESTVRASWFARAKQLVCRILLESPDSHILWVPLAIARGAMVLLTERVDVIYSSSPPHSSHLAAYILAKCFRKPHVVDFRDPWVTDAGMFRGWQQYAKQLVVTNAARLVVVSPGEPDDLRAEFSQLDGRRVAVLTNGYDPDDFAVGSGPMPDPRLFTITHAGTIYRETGQELFRALEQIVHANPPLRHVLRVNLIGEIDAGHHESVRRLEATGVVRRLGLQPHQATIAAIQVSDVLLILQRGGTSAASHIPAKVFEYLFAAKPILAIAAPGSLSELLTASGLGITVAPHDVTALADTIQALCRDRRAGELPVQADMAYISRFDRRNLTARFADLLEEAAHDA
jgi:glycosyltransferase involved in cell wall biosynthesis